jgi:hypothetical protein
MPFLASNLVSRRLTGTLFEAPRWVRGQFIPGQFVPSDNLSLRTGGRVAVGDEILERYIVQRPMRVWYFTRVSMG